MLSAFKVSILASGHDKLGSIESMFVGMSGEECSIEGAQFIV
jgi:hypothetical protein